MSALLHQIVRHAKATWEPHNAPTLSHNIQQLRQLVDRLTAADLRFPPGLLDNDNPHDDHFRTTQNSYQRRRAPCTYVPVLDHPDVTISVFVLRANQQMPLHDHPCMHGILKAISGRLAVECFTAVDADGQPVNAWPLETSASSDFASPPTIVPVRAEPAQIIDADSPAVLLTPSMGNYHRLCPMDGADAAFLDILSPPYNSASNDFGVRPCTYYRLQRLQPAVNDSADAERLALMATTQPLDFWCENMPYDLDEMCLGSELD